ncbi:MAG: hypothetical protein ACK4GM_15745 [Tabrizicola sp.]
MKILHRSETLIVLEDRPWFIGSMLILMALVFISGGLRIMAESSVPGGVLFAMFGGGVPLLVAALMVRRVRLTLDRSTGQLTRTMRSIRGLSRQSFPLARLVRAEVGSSTDSDGTSYRTELHLTGPTEKVPFTDYYTSGRKPEAMAQAINDWLDTTQ